MAGPRPGQRPEDGYRILCPCSFPSPQITRSTSAHVPARSSSRRKREREGGLGRVGNRQPGKAKLPLGAARFVSSACVVWAGGRTDVLIAFCIVGRAKSATHARSPGGCLSVCVPVRVWAFGGLAVAVAAPALQACNTTPSAWGRAGRDSGSERCLADALSARRPTLYRATPLSAAARRTQHLRGRAMVFSDRSGGESSHPDGEIQSGSSLFRLPPTDAW